LEETLLHKTTDDNDPTAASRKRDHIELAFKSQIADGTLDKRFFYEPLLAAHPEKNSYPQLQFLGKTMKVPIWVSSMTGGTAWAKTINHNLAKACRDFGMGMGLGSCRSLLFSDENLPDFDVRKIMGDDLPLYANLGIAQVEELADAPKLDAIRVLVDKLSADGLIIHVNPLQEWLQPEGDQFKRPPLDTIRQVLEFFPDMKVIVKEVGQGMGKESLKALFQLPLEAVDFAASGGTNFAKLEMLRGDQTRHAIFSKLAHVGHSAADMVGFSNEIKAELGSEMRCNQVIISGGVQNFLDGYYLINKLAISCVYGQASSFLKYAREDYEVLYNYVDTQIQGLELANAFLKVRT